MGKTAKKIQKQVLIAAEKLRMDGYGDGLVFPDLTIEAGRHMLLLGASGSGKTTLLHLMAGLLTPDGGTVSFRGRDSRGLSSRERDALRARHFGFIFQKLHLIGHLTALENLLLSFSGANLPPDRAKAQALLQELGLADRMHKAARTLSFGEAQRVAVARAVIHAPEVIFADEPTSALDDANAEKTARLLLEQAEQNGATLIVATHDARIKTHFKTVTEL